MELFLRVTEPPNFDESIIPLSDSLELFRNKRPGKLSSPKTMGGINRWGSLVETTVRCKPSLAYPKPHLPLCCPSSVPSTRPPSNTRMQQGSPPVRDSVNPAVAPKGNGPPWQSNDSLSSTITRRILPVMDSPCSWGWRAQKPMETCIRSHRFCTIPWCLSR